MQKDLLRVGRENMNYIKQILNKILQKLILELEKWKDS